MDSQFIQIKDVSRGCRRNLLPGEAYGAMGTWITEDIWTDGNVRRGKFDRYFNVFLELKC